MYAKQFLRVASAVVVTALAGCTINGPVREWQDPNEVVRWDEAEVVLPTAMPAEADLIEFDVRRRGQGYFFVDSAHIEIGKDGVTRLPVVTRSTGGAMSVTYEGFRCATSENRLYAIAAGGEWSEPKVNPWRPVGNSSFEPKSVLMQDFLCDGTTPLLPKDVIQKLRYPPTDWQ